MYTSYTPTGLSINAGGPKGMTNISKIATEHNDIPKLETMANMDDLKGA